MSEEMQTRRDRLYNLLERIPFASFIGFRCDVMGDEMTAILPFNQKLIGNQAVNALHGGAVGAFLEMTAMAQLYLLTDIEALPKPINLTIDYLRPGRPEDLFARAIMTKQGSRIANVKAEAWQAERNRPVATLETHFLLPTE